MPYQVRDGAPKTHTKTLPILAFGHEIHSRNWFHTESDSANTAVCVPTLSSVQESSLAVVLRDCIEVEVEVVGQLDTNTEASATVTVTVTDPALG